MNTFLRLLQTDLALWGKNIISKSVDVIIWGMIVCLVNVYIMPAFGTSSFFILIQAVGLIVGANGAEIFGQVFRMVSDFENEKYISYELTLPVSSWIIFMRLITLYTINGLFLCVLMLPVLKLVMGGLLPLTPLCVLWVVLALIPINAFFATFTLLLVGFVSSVARCGSIMTRVLFPLWFLGGFSFSYKIAHSIAQNYAYLMLLSPYTYATEMLRAIILGSDQFISIEICLFVLITLTLLFGMIGIMRIKKRLDYV